MFTVVALMCYVGTAADQACQEAVVGYQPVILPNSCMVTESELREWKEKSSFKGNDWAIKRLDCHHGNYKPKEST